MSMLYDEKKLSYEINDSSIKIFRTFPTFVIEFVYWIAFFIDAHFFLTPSAMNGRIELKVDCNANKHFQSNNLISYFVHNKHRCVMLLSENEQHESQFWAERKIKSNRFEWYDESVLRYSIVDNVELEVRFDSATDWEMSICDYENVLSIGIVRRCNPLWVQLFN